MAKQVGATVHFTAGSRAKIDRVLALGADHGILYKTEDFVEEVLRNTRGEGVDVVEDFIGPTTSLATSPSSSRPEPCSSWA